MLQPSPIDSRKCIVVHLHPSPWKNQNRTPDNICKEANTTAARTPNMMAPNMSFSPVRVIFCLAVPRMTARMMPENTTMPTISRKKTPTPKRWLCMPSILRSSREPGSLSTRTFIQPLPFDLRIDLVKMVDEKAVNKRGQKGKADRQQDCQRAVVEIDHVAILQFK